MTTLRNGGLLLLLLAAGCGGADASRPPPAATTAAAVAPPDVPAAPPAPSANPDADAVERARPSLRACYDKARAANAALGRTTATISFRVEPDGHVSFVDIEYKHRFDEPSKACMRDAAFAITFPKGEPRKVVLPVTFEAH